MRINKEKVKKIINSLEKGKKVCDIAKNLNLSYSSVSYYKNKEKTNARNIERFKNMPFKDRQKIYRNRQSYINNYIKTRYKNDPEFRRKHIAAVIKCQNNKK